MKIFEGRRNLILLIGSVSFVLFIVCASLYGNSVVYDLITNNGQAIGRGFTSSVTDTMVRYDSFQYVHIAEKGYTDTTYTAFFPLFPLLIKGLADLTGLSHEVAGLFINWVLLFPLAVMLYKWADLELKRQKVKVSPYILLGLIAIFPTSLYLAMAYTETLFMLLTVGAVYAYRSGRYFAAALLALLSSATRTQGLTLCVYFATDFLIEWHAKKKPNYKKLIPTFVGGLGFVAYATFLWYAFGNPLEFVEAQKSWGRLEGNVLTNLIDSFRPIYIFYLGVAGVGLWSIWRYLGKAYFIYSLLFLLLPLSSGRLDSINRYMLALIPMFLAITILSVNIPKLLRLIYIVLSTFLLAWSILLFANGYWVA